MLGDLLFLVFAGLAFEALTLPIRWVLGEISFWILNEILP